MFWGVIVQSGKCECNFCTENYFQWLSQKLCHMLYSTVNDESDIHGHKKEFFDLQFDVIWQDSLEIAMW